MGSELHMSYSTVRRIENGEFLPEKKDMDDIARLFGFNNFFNNWFQIEKYNQQILYLRKLQICRDSENFNEKIHSFLKVKTLEGSFFFPQYIFLAFYQEVMNSKNLDSIIAHYNELSIFLELYSNEQSCMIYDSMGIVYLENCHYGNAKAFFEKAIQCSGNDFLAHLHLAMVYQYLKFDIYCLDELKICKELIFQFCSVDRFIQISQIEALVKAERGEYDWAISRLLDLYEEGVRLNNEDLMNDLLNNLAYVFFISKDYLNSILYSKKSLSMYPENVDSVLYLYIIYSYFRTEQIEEMDKIIDKCYEQPLEDHIRFLIPGIKAWSRKDYKLAENNFFIAYSESELKKEIDWKVWILECLIELNEFLGDFDKVLKYSNELLLISRHQKI